LDRNESLKSRDERGFFLVTILLMIRTFLHRLPQRIAGAYSNRRWMWHVLAALSTAVLVFGGVDWWFFEHTRDIWRPLILIAGLGGFFMPFVIAVGLYVTGRKRAGVAVGQASFLGWLISSLYKVFTGRVQPEYLSHLQTTDYSHVFHFGILKYGIFWGWPSSHAAATVAGMVALYIVWPNTFVRTLVIVWAAVVCVGAAVGFHWLSDVIAGALIGVAIGAAVAKDGK
jgi:membrane-associated phospholipid phosphatase